MKKIHHIGQIRFVGDKLTIQIDGIYHEYFLSKISNRLANASDVERKKYLISPSGYGVHWPLLDEDLSIDGLLGIKHQPTKNKKVPIN